MKEKILRNKIKRGVFGVVLALAMVVALMPTNSMTVYADDYIELGSISEGYAAYGSLSEWDPDGEHGKCKNGNTKFYDHADNDFTVGQHTCEHGNAYFVCYPLSCAPSNHAPRQGLNDGDKCVYCGLPISSLPAPTCTCTNADHTVHYYVYYKDENHCFIRQYAGATYAGAEGSIGIADSVALVGKPFEVGGWYWSSFSGSSISGGICDSSHTHGPWKYSASGATLTVECKAPTGTCNIKKTSLTLLASDAKYSGKSVVASLQGTSDWAAAKFKIPTIKYVGRDGTNYAETETAPKEVGKYTAKITAGGASASVNYSITKDEPNPIDTGKVEVPREKEANNFAAGTLASNPKELESLIELDDYEKSCLGEGFKLNVWTEITKQEENSVGSEEKQKINNILPATYNIGTYLDIKLKKQLTVLNEKETVITKTIGKVKLKLTVPTELQRAGRTYDIIRLHNGEATVLGTTREGYELTFETDGFSTYALIYSDAALASKVPVSAVISAKTGDTSNMPLIMLILSLGIGLGFALRKKFEK